MWKHINSLGNGQLHCIYPEINQSLLGVEGVSVSVGVGVWRLVHSRLPFIYESFN